MSRGTLLSINGSMVFIQSLMVEIVVPLIEVHTMSTQELVSGLGAGKSQELFHNQNSHYDRYGDKVAQLFRCWTSNQ